MTQRKGRTPLSRGSFHQDGSEHCPRGEGRILAGDRGVHSAAVERPGGRGPRAAVARGVLVGAVL
eukprot:6075487-Prymnesium_polylepis.1